MLRYLFNRVTFALERLIVRGAFHQLLFIAALIVLVSIVAGTVVWLFVPEFGDYLEAVWWGFLRLSDPGYLGDDTDALARTVSTIVTVLGYVLFMGALVAIMTQGLGRMMRRLESGVSPISVRGHILVLGWTNRTSTVVKELLLSEARVRRFLKRLSMRRLRIVVMVDEVTADLAGTLAAGVGDSWHGDEVILRSGDPLRYDHLERVNFLDAAAIILPSGDSGTRNAETLDARVIKTLLSMANTGRPEGRRALPILTTELVDPDKVEIARAAYPGDLEVLPGAVVISRLIAQNVRHNGLSGVYWELLSYGTGSEIYARECRHLAGRPFGDLEGRYSRAIPLGVLRGEGEAAQALLNPPADLEIRETDKLAFLAGRYDDIVEDGGLAPDPAVETRLHEARDEPERRFTRRVLVLGWNLKLPTLVGEFESYAGERFELDVVSLVPAAERERLTDRYCGPTGRSTVRHIEADFTAPRDLERIAPREYDNVVFLASERMDSEEESDARTLLGNLVLQSLLPTDAARPKVLIELIDPENVALFTGRTGEVLISPIIISHILAHITLRRELSAVFEELFTADGAEIYFRPPAHYGLAGGAEFRFRDIQRLVAARGDIALGVCMRGDEAQPHGRVRLNPAQDSTWSFGDADEIIVLTTYS